MLLELTEALRCPNPHDESYMICAPVTSDGRDVVRGGLLCPVCRAQFAILDRVAWLAPPGDAPRAMPAGPLTADAAVTFLALEGAGGFVALAGAAGRLAPALAAALPQVNVVVANGPPDLVTGGAFSVLHAPGVWPLRRNSLRGAVLGSDAAGEPWLTGAIGSVLPGLRVIVEDAAADHALLGVIARGAGVVVAERRNR